MSSADRREPFGASPHWLRTWPRRYGFAVLAVAAATALTFGLQQLGPLHTAFVLYFPAVVLVAMYAGFGPGILATVLAATAADFFFLEPVNSFRIRTPEGLIGEILFVLLGVFLTVLTHSHNRAKQALRESEDRYRDLVEHSEDLVCTHDLEGRLISVNPAPARVLGYDVAELLQIPMRELIAPEFREQFDAYLARIRTASADKGLLSVLTRSGERRTWEYNNTLRTEGVASPIVRGMAHDVTERKRAEKALRESEERFRSLYENATIGLYRTTPDGKVLLANPSLVKMLGFSSFSELSQRNLEEEGFEPGYERAEFQRRLANEGEVRGLEASWTRRDGAAIFVRESAKAIRNKEGEIAYYEGTVEDITERKQAAEALRRSEQSYRLLFERNVAGVVILDADDGSVVECNDACARMMGYDNAAEVQGKMMPDYYVDPAERQKLVAEVKQRGIIFNREAWLKRKDGSKFCVLLNSVRLGLQEDRDLFQATVIDITERKKAEDALQGSEQNYRNFVAQSSEGIFREDLDQPVPIDLPEDELVHGILYGSCLAECNDAMAKMYGHNSARDFLGKRLTETLDPSDPHNIELTREYVRSGFRVVERESHEVDLHGNPKVFLNSLIGIVENGKLMRTWGIQRDITKRVKAEEAQRKAEHGLVESEERFRVAIQNSPMTVFCQDRNLRYTWVYNPHLFVRQVIIGKTDDELIGADQARALSEVKRRVLETGTGVREEVTVPHNGKKYFFDFTLEPLRDASQGVVGITGAAVDVARLRELADRLAEQRDKLVQEKSYLEGEIGGGLGFEHIIGQSPALRDVLKSAKVVAPTDSTVLLLGETGTGKELVARAIHSLSARQDKNFIKLNCAAVPTGLLESELFGHEKGAFTGAVNQKIGRLEMADKGTMFLDEIGELPLELQPKLLRVLQDREFERLGGVRTVRVDVRVISATNRDLRKDVAEKRFREDLFYRLNVFPISMPALRERRSDIPVLVRHFVEKHAVRMGKRIETIPDETVKVLQNWSWPGNIRELENMIERMVILTKGEVLAAPPLELNASQSLSRDDLREIGREHIIRILQETRGVLSGADGAASRLGVKRTTLQSMLKRFGIEPEEFRRGTGTYGPE